MFWPIPGLISCTGMTGRWGLLTPTHNTVTMQTCLEKLNYCTLSNSAIGLVSYLRCSSAGASVITGLDYWTGLLDSNFNALKIFLTRSTSLYSFILHYLGLLFSGLELLSTLTSH